MGRDSGAFERVVRGRGARFDAGSGVSAGDLFASPTNTVQYALRDRVGYQWALAGFEIVTIGALALLLWFGAEEHGKIFVHNEKA